MNDVHLSFTIFKERKLPIEERKNAVAVPATGDEKKRHNIHCLYEYLKKFFNLKCKQKYFEYKNCHSE